jgi:predicted transglutaminase-like cysteine proteinase
LVTAASTAAAPACAHASRDGTMRRGRGLARLFVIAALGVLTGHADPRLDRVEATAQARYGAAVAERVRHWRGTLAALAGASEREQLEHINRYINRQVRFSDDPVVWQQKDYWATPLETYWKQAGDCEDFVIAKYFSLRQLGIANEKLRLIYVRAKIGGPNSSLTQAHMVLGYYATPTAEPLVLDNLLGDIHPASRRTDLFPIFSFNSSGLWVQGASTPSASATARLSRWRDLIDRMRAEGFEQ